MDPNRVALVVVCLICVAIRLFSIGYAKRSSYNYNLGRKVGAGKEGPDSDYALHLTVVAWSLMLFWIGGLAFLIGWLTAGNTSYQIAIRVGKGDTISEKIFATL